MQKMNSLYIHFPFCQHLCNYCDFYKHKLTDVEQIDTYEEQLLEQIDLHEKFLAENDMKLEELETIYIGGGTPSLWKSRGAQFIKNFLTTKNILLAENVEFTIEVDPDTWTEEEIEDWIDAGVNRFSIGSQAFTEELLDVMDRTHGLADVEKTMKYMKDRGLNYSVDLMIGLPRSSERDLRDEIDRILVYNPSHISVYILKARKKYPLVKELPEDEKIRSEYLFVSEYLKSKNFVHYEVSNFARNESFSKHNLKYWNYDSVAALGPNATGLIVKNNKATRYHWKSRAVGYVTEEIEGNSLLIEKIFLGLRNFNGIDLKELFPAQAEVEKVIELHCKWTGLGYLDVSSSDDLFRLNALGYLMSDSLLDDIFKEIDF